MILTSIVYACIQCCCSKDPPVAEPVTPKGDLTASPDCAAGELSVQLEDNQRPVVSVSAQRPADTDVSAASKASTVQTPTPTPSTTPTPTSTGSDNASCFGWCDSRDSGSGRLCGSGSGSNVELPPDSMNATNDTVRSQPRPLLLYALIAPAPCERCTEAMSAQSERARLRAQSIVGYMNRSLTFPLCNWQVN